jgi:thioredoxin 1
LEFWAQQVDFYIGDSWVVFLVPVPYNRFGIGVPCGERLLDTLLVIRLKISLTKGRKRIMNERFKAIINSDKPVLVDFYADWCEPCKMMVPILKTVKKDMGRVRVLKVNVDHNPLIAHSYGIHSLPTVMLFKKGEPRWMGVGIQSACDIKEIVSNHL